MATVKQLWLITGRVIGLLLTFAFWYVALIGFIAIAELFTR